MINLTKALTMVLVLIFHKGIASGKRVEARIIVKRYSLPDLVFGHGLDPCVVPYLVVFLTLYHGLLQLKMKD